MAQFRLRRQHLGRTASVVIVTRHRTRHDDILPYGLV
jgi:hypothetical protein